MFGIKVSFDYYRLSFFCALKSHNFLVIRSAGVSDVAETLITQTVSEMLKKLFITNIDLYSRIFHSKNKGFSKNCPSAVLLQKLF